jgi:hypothetical protein
MADISPKLRGTLPAAARSKMVHHRAYNAGRGDDPHGVTQQDSDDLDMPAGMEKHSDFDSSKSFLTKVED